MTALTPDAARRVFLLLTATRWFPVGLVVGTTTLWPLAQGLSVAEALSASAFVGLTVFALELPTSGFADAFGRRPVYLAASIVAVVATVAFYTASQWWQFALAAVAFGVFRALDSGPLEAWFVDTVHAWRPGADVDGDLARQGTALGGSIAIGALVGGALVWWDPIAPWSPLLLPGVVSGALGLLHIVAVALLMRETRVTTSSDESGESSEPADESGETVRQGRSVTASIRQTPVVIAEGLALVRRNRVLAGLIAVEVAWSGAMVVFESLQPIRLAELLDSQSDAAAWMGPIAAVGWGVYAGGSALGGWLSARHGVARTAIAARALNSVGTISMGLVAGPLALVSSYLATYSLHGANGPVHSALLHREARARNRATILSINSMAAFLSFSVVATGAGLVATRASTATAMVTIGVASLLGTIFYWPALRAEG